MASYALCPIRSESDNLIIKTILEEWEDEREQAHVVGGGIVPTHYFRFFVPSPSYGEFFSLQPHINFQIKDVIAAITIALATEDSTDAIIERLDEVIADEDQYELDELPPSQTTIDAVKRLLRSMADVGYNNLPKTYISLYHGEIAVTWKTDRNLVRLTFRPNGSIELYRQPNYRDSARGESIPVTVEDNERVAEYIHWLSGVDLGARPERPVHNR